MIILSDMPLTNSSLVREIYINMHAACIQAYEENHMALISSTKVLSIKIF